jgi:hypothetical protein
MEKKMIIKVGDNSGNTDFHRRLFLKKSYDASGGSPLNLCFLQNIITELEGQLQEITRDEIIGPLSSFRSQRGQQSRGGTS